MTWKLPGAEVFSITRSRLTTSGSQSSLGGHTKLISLRETKGCPLSASERLRRVSIRFEFRKPCPLAALREARVRLTSLSAERCDASFRTYHRQKNTAIPYRRVPKSPCPSPSSSATRASCDPCPIPSGQTVGLLESPTSCPLATSLGRGRSARTAQTFSLCRPCRIAYVI